MFLTTVLISICTSIVVSAIGAWIAFGIEKKKQFYALKIQARSEMIEEWKAAHLGLYKELLIFKNYINLFTESGNELKKSEDKKNFAPLRQFTSLYEFTNNNSIFFSEKLTRSVSGSLDSMGILNSIALAYAGGAMDGESLPDDRLINAISECNNLLDEIKSEVGLSKISFNK